MSRMPPASAKSLKELCEGLWAGCVQVTPGQEAFTQLLKSSRAKALFVYGQLGLSNHCTLETISASRRCDNEASYSSNMECMKSCFPKHKGARIQEKLCWLQMQESLRQKSTFLQVVPWLQSYYFFPDCPASLPLIFP